MLLRDQKHKPLKNIPKIYLSALYKAVQAFSNNQKAQLFPLHSTPTQNEKNDHKASGSNQSIPKCQILLFVFKFIKKMDKLPGASPK